MQSWRWEPWHWSIRARGCLEKRSAVRSAAGWGVVRSVFGGMTYALYPQSGIAIGLVILMSNDGSIPEEIKHTVSAIVLAECDALEIIGPSVQKRR